MCSVLCQFFLWERTRHVLCTLLRLILGQATTGDKEVNLMMKHGTLQLVGWSPKSLIFFILAHL